MEFTTLTEKEFIKFNGLVNNTKIKGYTIKYGNIVDDKNDVIDEVLVSVMKAPKTFTCEDVIEINCHGGIATTNKILELILLNGARLAEPGEFTKRAFLNGRIDLVEAESVMDLIDSKTEQARKLSINQLNGKVSSIIRTFRQKLLELLASIEVNIDYPEYEDIEEITNENIKNEIKYIKEELNNIIKESENGKIIRNGIKVAIVGRPNVGKSSLLNRFLDEEKAIVTDIAGTTRDIVEGQVSIDGILFNFVDTAGIRESDDYVEQIGITKAKEVLEEVNYPLTLVGDTGLQQLTYYSYKDKVASGEPFIVVIEREGCSYCTMYMPVLEEVAKEKDIPLYFIDIATLTNAELIELETTNKYLKKNSNWGTPTTIFMQGNRILDSLAGYTDKNGVLSFLDGKVEMGE